MENSESVPALENDREVVGELNTEPQERRLRSPRLAVALADLAQRIRVAAAEASNEAEVASIFETRIYGFLLKSFQTEFTFKKEEPVATVRHVAKGRIDSRVGWAVIEYKHSSKLKNASAQAAATKQIVTYMESLKREQSQALVGVVTDGIKAQVIHLDEHGLAPGAFHELKEEDLQHIVRSALLLQKVALTPQNLVKDFCRVGSSGSSVFSALTLALYAAISAAPTERSKMLFSEWQCLFRLAHDDVSKQKPIAERRAALGEALEIKISRGDNETEYRALYALQTAFAITVKLIGLKVISAVRMVPGLISFSELAGAEKSVIRGKLARLEAGDVFRDAGFRNLLEGDFFAWYCTEGQWTNEISAAVRKVLSTLSPYEAQPLLQGKADVKDFFKDLYLQIMPDKVRHSLGEFYTPSWLADRVVSRALETAGVADNKWRGLDPCCGSGTFITAMLHKKLEALADESRSKKLSAILADVKAIDLNPLAVLTARINYFINISTLIEDGDEFEIPVFLGDASYVPESMLLEKVRCLKYEIGTLEGPIEILMPQSAVRDVDAFSAAMTEIEGDIKNRDKEAIYTKLLRLCAPSDRTAAVQVNLTNLAARLVRLEEKDWNGIWARIITNFLTTANLGRFDVIVGNPPWVDWKNLPAGYRVRIKGLCVDRHLFSGDAVTGGINLNICALISNVAAENWLVDHGSLAFLMPEPLLFQQSYEGFRRFFFKDGSRAYFQAFEDWTRAGHPFAPVQQPFLTYVLARKSQDYRKGVEVISFKKKRGTPNLQEFQHKARFEGLGDIFDVKKRYAITANADSTKFTYVDSKRQLKAFPLLAGKNGYLGRDGLQFYPQELFLLRYLKKGAPERVYVENYQDPDSQVKLARQQRLLETEFLFPMVKSTSIRRFDLAPSEFVVPYPYEEMSRSPITPKQLGRRARLLMSYLNDYRSVLENQSTHNKRIIGEKHNTAFYALARVGEYTYGTHFVTFRKDTDWCAVVASDLMTPWGERKRPLFQSHAASISQGPSGAFLTLDEAHYVCAILNAPIVGEFILNSSDSRSFKVRPPIRIPPFDRKSEEHQKLVELSKKAHKIKGKGPEMTEIDALLDSIYLSMLGFGNADA